MKMPKIVHVEPPDGPSEHEKLSAENAALMAQAASALGDAEALRTENEALRTHRDQLTEDLGSLEDRMQELRARVASEYRKGHAAGQEAAMESAAALRARVEQYQRALEVLYSDESGDLDYIKWYITEKVLTIEARNAIDAGGLSGNKPVQQKGDV